MKLRDAVRDEPIVVQLHVAAHAIELQHCGDAVGFFQTHVRDIFQYGFTLRERAQRRQDGQHVGDVAAVDANCRAARCRRAARGRACACASYAIGSPISRNDLHKCAFGMVRKLSRKRSQAAKEHVRGMKRRRGEAERRRTDVGWKLECRRTRLLTRVRSRSAANPARFLRANRRHASSRPLARCTGARSVRLQPR